MTGFAVTRETVFAGSPRRTKRDTLGDGLRLRDAIRSLLSSPSGCERMESDDFAYRFPQRFRAFAGDTFARSAESRILHVPATVTRASRVRIARLLGCHGA